MLNAEQKNEAQAATRHDMDLEQREQRLDERALRLEERFELYSKWDEDASARQGAAFQREMELKDWERRLVDRERVLGLIANPGASAGTARERAKTLLDEIAQRETWRGEAEDRDSRGTRLAAERLASILKQAKSARTALGKVEQAFKDILTKGEAEALAAARSVLTHIAEAAQLAKEQGRRLAEERQRHEEEIAKAASAAMHAAFDDVLATPAGRVLFAAAADSSGYEFRKLVSGEAFARSYKRFDYSQRREIEYPQDIFEETLKGALSDAQCRLASRIRDEIGKGVNATEAAQAMRDKFDSGLPELRERHGGLAQRVTTEIVARQLEHANRCTSART